MASELAPPHGVVAQVRRGAAARLGLLAGLAVMLCVTACTSANGAPAASSPAVPAALPSAPAAGPQSLSEAGSTLLFPLFARWAAAYRSQFPGIVITTSATGSTKGVSAAAAGVADIGASDAYLPSSTVVRYPVLENVPLVVSAQLVSYNLPGVGDGLKLSSAILAQMYQGTITRWNDAAIKALNPGVSLPALPVVAVHRSDGSGDTFLFTSYLSQPDSSWASAVGFANTVAWPAAPGALSAQGNAGMVAACGAHPGCVAYIGISYLAQAQAAGLGSARLLNRAGNYVQPDASSIGAAADAFASLTPANGAMSLVDSLAAGGYPIVNFEYAIVSTRQPTAARAQTVKALLNWILTTGSSPAYLSQVHFQPLPSQVAAIANQLIARIA